MTAAVPIDEAELAALIGSRICHDLVSPVGAVGNGVELIGMAAQAGAPPASAELELVRQSVETAQAKLRFFRIAFGQASVEQAVGRAEVLSILTELYGAGRLRVHWAVDEGLPRAEVRLAFLLLLCLESAMPRGGQVHMSRPGEAWRIVGEGGTMQADPALWDALRAAAVPPALRPSQVQFGLVPAALARLGFRLTVEVGQTRIALAAGAGA